MSASPAPPQIEDNGAFTIAVRAAYNRHGIAAVTRRRRYTHRDDHRGDRERHRATPVTLTVLARRRRATDMACLAVLLIGAQTASVALGGYDHAEHRRGHLTVRYAAKFKLFGAPPSLSSSLRRRAVPSRTATAHIDDAPR